MRRQAFAVGPVGAAGRPLFSCAAGRSPLRPVTRRAFVVRCSQDTGGTALIWAAVNGEKEVVQLLIEAGANREARDNTGYTALDCARNRNKHEVVRLLEVRG